jgi:sugar lactone lactonase YvrE
MIDKLKIVLVVLIVVAFKASAQEDDFKSFYANGIAAYRAKDYPKFYSLISKANELHQGHEGILYQLGIAAALTGHQTESIDALTRAMLMNNSIRVEGLADFNAIKNTPGFKNLLALQKEWATPVIHSDTAFILKDRTLHCEGIEFDAEANTFYAGSIHQRKIVKIKDGIATDFNVSGAEGMTAVFALRIDRKNKLLWAASSPVPEMMDFDSTARSALYKYDLVTGKLLERIQQPLWKKNGVFGDLVVNKNGDVFVSDGQTNTVFILNSKNRKLEPWYTAPEFSNIQGMAFSDNEKYLFIADYAHGVFRLDVKAKTLIKIKSSLQVSLKGIDGLCFYKNSLITIQNGVTPLRSTRYYLNNDQDQFTKFDIIDRNHPAFNEPTQGVVHDDVFYYIANSQWNGYDRQHKLKPVSQLQDLVVLKYQLK